MSKKNKMFIVLYYIGAALLCGLYLALGTASAGQGYIPYIDEETLTVFFSTLIAFYAASYLIQGYKRVSVWSVLSLVYIVSYAFTIFAYFYNSYENMEVYNYIAITCAFMMCLTAFLFLYFSFFLAKHKKLKETNIYLPIMFIVFVVFMACICAKFDEIIFYEGNQYPYSFYVANFAFLLVSIYAVSSLDKKETTKAPIKKAPVVTTKKTTVKKTTKKPVKKSTKK